MTVLRGVSRAGYRAVLLFVSYLALAALALGQETGARHEASAKLPEFEVATIKPHPKGPRFFTVAWPPGRFEAKNVTAKLLVEQAFNVPDDQVSGEPDWADSQHFDVAAKIDDAQLAEISELDSFRQLQSMQLRLQSLLKERFRLAIIHKPQRRLVYALVVTRGGAKLHAPGAPKPAESSDAGGKSNLTTVDKEDAQVIELANFLSMHFKRTVLDRTGLSGRYDIRLQFAVPDGSTQEDADAALFKALESQLGLKVVLRREVVDTIVIEHLELPSEN